MGHCLFQSVAKTFQSWAITSKWDKVLFQIRAVILKWGNYFEKGHNSGPLKCVWFLPDSKAPCSLKHLRDNLVEANCDLGNMCVNFLNKHFLIDDIGTLTVLQLLSWNMSSVEKTSIYDKVFHAFLFTFYFVRKGDIHSCDIRYSY